MLLWIFIKNKIKNWFMHRLLLSQNFGSVLSLSHSSPSFSSTTRKPYCLFSSFHTSIKFPIHNTTIQKWPLTNIQAIRESRVTHYLQILVFNFIFLSNFCFVFCFYVIQAKSTMKS